MRTALLALVAGCGFEVSPSSAVDASASDGAAGDGGEADSAVPDAMLPDAPMMTVEACTVVHSGPAAQGTLLGGTGQRSGDVTCAGDQLAVGLQFDVSPAGVATHGDHILLTTIRLWCGTISRTTQNQMVTTNLTVESYTALQGSNPSACDAYKPPTTLAQVMCPAGAVLVGIAGHQVDSTLYNDVAIHCAAVAPSGQISTSAITIAMPGTGTNAMMAEQAVCPASTAITSLHATSGCGQDGVTPTCNATSCVVNE